MGKLHSKHAAICKPRESPEGDSFVVNACLARKGIDDWLGKQRYYCASARLEPRDGPRARGGGGSAPRDDMEEAERRGDELYRLQGAAVCRLRGGGQPAGVDLHPLRLRQQRESHQRGHHQPAAHHLRGGGRLRQPRRAQRHAEGQAVGGARLQPAVEELHAGRRRHVSPQENRQVHRRPQERGQEDTSAPQAAPRRAARGARLPQRGREPRAPEPLPGPGGHRELHVALRSRADPGADEGGASDGPVQPDSLSLPRAREWPRPLPPPPAAAAPPPTDCRGLRPPRRPPPSPHARPGLGETRPPVPQDTQPHASQAGRRRGPGDAEPGGPAPHGETQPDPPPPVHGPLPQAQAAVQGGPPGPGAAGGEGAAPAVRGGGAGSDGAAPRAPPSPRAPPPLPPLLPGMSPLLERPRHCTAETHGRTGGGWEERRIMGGEEDHGKRGG
ncbi:protein naked cuticle homolog 1 isoform X1 [Pseudoliparis swirei]|uniref:protein naked cuticle homolog 1 isoform X1 n=1 Tax=Pseudoliparis swirei TaxID=2059687 RepID=UPI0024BD5F11|nr:protein naked cuticle homolog 1 isoform X1 [Pseudoliparis swirei]